MESLCTTLVPRNGRLLYRARNNSGVDDFRFNLAIRFLQSFSFGGTEKVEISFRSISQAFRRVMELEIHGG
jgi:hypothetical protein